MTCAHCEALKAQVAELRRELGYVDNNSQLATLAARYGMTPTESRIALSLYNAQGRVLTFSQIDEFALPERERSYEVIKVYVSRIRKLMAGDVIENAHGVGYRMTALGRALIYQALKSVEVAA